MHPLVVKKGDTPYDVYIGRGSIWGNPFVIGRHGSREEVIAKYEVWIKNQPALIKQLPTLRGKTLGCFCAPLPCHGEVLIRLLDSIDTSTKSI